MIVIVVVLEFRRDRASRPVHSFVAVQQFKFNRPAQIAAKSNEHHKM
jgi:hypothetical protein